MQSPQGRRGGAGGVRQVVFFTGRNLVSLAPDSGELHWKAAWKI